MVTLKDLYRASALSAAIAVGLSIFALGGGLIQALILAGFAYAIIEYWGKNLGNPILIMLYVLALYAVAIFTVQFAIMLSAVVAAFAVASRPKLSGRPAHTLVYPIRMVGLASMALAAPLVLLYEAIRRGSWLYRLYMVIGAIGWVMALMGLAPFRLYLASLSAPLFALNVNQANPLVWIGLIGYEEWISRAVGPIGNAFWVLLHIPSRYLMLGSILGAIGVVAYIQIGARWLWDTYQKGGLVGSLIGHAIYNAWLSLLASTSLLMWPTIIGIGIILYFATQPFGHVD